MRFRARCLRLFIALFVGRVRKTSLAPSMLRVPLVLVTLLRLPSHSSARHIGAFRTNNSLCRQTTEQTNKRIQNLLLRKRCFSIK